MKSYACFIHSYTPNAKHIEYDWQITIDWMNNHNPNYDKFDPLHSSTCSSVTYSLVSTTFPSFLVISFEEELSMAVICSGSRNRQTHFQITETHFYYLLGEQLVWPLASLSLLVKGIIVLPWRVVVRLKANTAYEACSPVPGEILVQR